MGKIRPVVVLPWLRDATHSTVSVRESNYPLTCDERERFRRSVKGTTSPAAVSPVVKPVLGFGELPSTGLGPELADGGRAALECWAGENYSPFRMPR